ncbi:MAG: FHA domain-containing protein, partial [Polyangiales bacterium]
MLRSIDRDWPLERGDLTVGRTAECDIVLDDASVSRRHAVLHVS